MPNNLNTSHVKVQSKFLVGLVLYKVNLNTSHVKVQLKAVNEMDKSLVEFKYISC